MSEAIFSPNRDFKVSFVSYEVRMSHWIDQPFLMRMRDNACLFALDTGDWSAWAVRWLDESTVELAMRKYPGQLEATVTLNVLTKQATAESRADSCAGSFPAVQDWVLGLT